jgi:hypothetical protein
MRDEEVTPWPLLLALPEAEGYKIDSLHPKTRQKVRGLLKGASMRKVQGFIKPKLRKCSEMSRCACKGIGGRNKCCCVRLCEGVLSACASISVREFVSVGLPHW